MSNCLDSDQDGHSVGPDLGSNCLQRLSASMRGSRKFCQRGSNFDNNFFFKLMRDGRIQVPL